MRLAIVLPMRFSAAWSGDIDGRLAFRVLPFRE